nr:guanylate kinase [Maliibacterium massiliense]
MNNKQGLLLVVSGPSGAGKGTVCRALRALRPDMRISVSVTTRDPRPGEEEGVHYYFRSKEQFAKMEQEGAFLETAEVYGNRYGTPVSGVRKMLMDGHDVLLEIDIQGALQVKDRFDEGVFVFVVPPSMEELRARIVGRATEDEQTILRRFQSAYNEINFITRYNYVVVNDQVADAAARIDAILTAESCRVVRNPRLQNMLLGGERI